jgi:hypothetical protein
MTAFKHLNVTSKDQIKARKAWKRYFKEGCPYGIDPNIDPSVCILMGRGPEHYRNRQMESIIQADRTKVTQARNHRTLSRGMVPKDS